MDASLKVSFEATQDDLVDVSIRSMKRSGTWDRQRVNAAITTGILAAVMIFAALSLTRSSLESRLIFAAMTGIGSALLSPLFFTRGMEQRLRDYFRRQYGNHPSLVIEVELDAQGISFKQLGTRYVHEWSTVQDIQTASDKIDFLFSNKSLATVRTRAFESPMRQREFVDLANAYRKASRPTPSNAL